MINEDEDNYFGGWPYYIIYEGRKVYQSQTNPNHAGYMLSGAYMNRIIWISKDQFIRHNKLYDSI